MKTVIDIELLRDRLSVAQGKRYWRSLEELAEHPGFEEMLHREFPRQAFHAPVRADPAQQARAARAKDTKLSFTGSAGGTSIVVIGPPVNPGPLPTLVTVPDAPGKV